MKELLLYNQRKIVIVSSGISLLLFILMLIDGITALVKLNETGRSFDELFEEFSILLYWFVLIVPALLGLFYYAKSKRPKSLLICMAFILYFITNLVTYGTYFQATDALEAGLLFVILGMPVSMFLGIILGLAIIKQKWG